MDHRQELNGLGVAVEVPAQAEERIVAQLTAIGWTDDLEDISLQIIGRLCNCTDEEASTVLDKLVELQVIERVGGEGPTQFGAWAWVEGQGSH